MVLRLIFFLPLIIVGILEFSILEGGGVRGVSVYRITSIKRLGRLLNFSIFRGRCLFEGAFNRGGVYKILAIFFSHKIKTTYKILKSLQYFKKFTIFLALVIIFFIYKGKRGREGAASTMSSSKSSKGV